MLCQMGRFEVRKGPQYRFILDQGRGLEGVPVLVALVNMDGWGWA